MQEIVRSTRGLKSRRLKGKARLNRKITLCLASIICCLSFVAVGVLASLTDVSISIDNDAYYYATAFNKNANDEFIIRTYNDLVAMSNLVNSNTLVPDTNVYYKDAKYYLANDIDPVAEAIANGASEEDAKSRTYLLSPIGKNSESAFSGVFRGDGHTISNIRIILDSTDGFYGGLFGYTTGATITGVGLGTPINPGTNIFNYLNANVQNGNWISLGTLVGYATGKYDANGNLLRKTTISECYSYSNIKLSNSLVTSAFSSLEAPVWGMLVGCSSKGTDISNCYTTGYAYSDNNILESPIVSVRCTGNFSSQLDSLTNCYSISSNSEANIYCDQEVGYVKCVYNTAEDDKNNCSYFFNSKKEDDFTSGGAYDYTTLSTYVAMSDSDALTNAEKMQYLNANPSEGRQNKWVACPNNGATYYFPQLKIFINKKFGQDLAKAQADGNKDFAFYHFKKTVDLEIHNFVYDPYDSFENVRGKFLHGSKGGNMTIVSHNGIVGSPNELMSLTSIITDSSANTSSVTIEAGRTKQVLDCIVQNTKICNIDLSFELGADVGSIVAKPNKGFNFKGFILVKQDDELVNGLKDMIFSVEYSEDVYYTSATLGVTSLTYSSSLELASGIENADGTYTLDKTLKVDFTASGKACFIECDENGNAINEYMYIAVLYSPNEVSVNSDANGNGRDLIVNKFINNEGETLYTGGNNNPALVQYYGSKPCTPMVPKVSNGTPSGMEFLSSEYFGHYALTSTADVYNVSLTSFYVSNYKGSGINNNGAVFANNGSIYKNGTNNLNDYHFLTISVPNLWYNNKIIDGNSFSGPHSFNGFFDDLNNKIIPDELVYSLASYMTSVSADAGSSSNYTLSYINVMFNEDGNLNLLDNTGMVITNQDILDKCGYVMINGVKKTSLTESQKTVPYVITKLVTIFTEKTVKLNLNMVLVDINGDVVSNAKFPKELIVGAKGYVSNQNEDFFFSNPVYNAGIGIVAESGKLSKNYGASTSSNKLSYLFMNNTPVTLLADEMPGYNFIGFYSDSDCTNIINSSINVNSKISDRVKVPDFASATIKLPITNSTTLPTDSNYSPKEENIYVKYQIKTLDFSIKTAVGDETDATEILASDLTIWDDVADASSYKYGQFSTSIYYFINKFNGTIKSFNDTSMLFNSFTILNVDTEDKFGLASYSTINITPKTNRGFTADSIWAEKADGGYIKIASFTGSRECEIICFEKGIPLYDSEGNAQIENGNYKYVREGVVNLVVKFIPENSTAGIGSAYESSVDGVYVHESNNLAQIEAGTTSFSSYIATKERPYIAGNNYTIGERRVVLAIDYGEISSPTDEYSSFLFTLSHSDANVGYRFCGWYGALGLGTPTDFKILKDIDYNAKLQFISKENSIPIHFCGGFIIYGGVKYSQVFALFERTLIFHKEETLITDSETGNIKTETEYPVHTAVGGCENTKGQPNIGGVEEVKSSCYMFGSGNSIIYNDTISSETKDINGMYKTAGNNVTKHKSWLKISVSEVIDGYKFIGYTTNKDDLKTPIIKAEDLTASSYTIYVELVAINATVDVDGYLIDVVIGRMGVADESGTLSISDPTDVTKTINIKVFDAESDNSKRIYALFERIPIADAIHGLNGMGISLENGTLSDGTNDSSADAFHTANEPVLNEGLASGSDPMGEVQVSYVSSKRLTTTDAEGNILITTTYTTFDNQNNNCNHISLNGDINDLFIINIFPYYGFKIKDIYLKTSSGWSQLDAESNTIKVTDGTVTPENQGVALYDYYYRLAINRTETTQTETEVSNAGAFTEGVTEFSFTTSGETTNYSAIIVTFEPEDYNISYAPNSKDIYARSLVRKSGDDVFNSESAVQWKYPVDGTATYGDKPSGENTLKSTHSYAYNEKYQKTGFSTYAELFKNSYGQNCSDTTSNYYIQNNESKGAYEVPGYVFLGWGLYTSDGYLSLAITTDYYLYGVEGATTESVAKTYASILAKLDNVTYFTHSSSTEVGLTFNANIQDNNGNYQNLSRLLYGYRDANNTTKLRALWVPETGNTEHDTYLVIHGFGDVKVGDNNHLNLNTYTTYGVGSSIGYDLSMPLKDASKIGLSYSRYGLQIDYGFSVRTINFTAIANNDSAKFIGFNNWKTTDHSFAQYKAGRYSGISRIETIHITNLDLTREDNGNTGTDLCLNIYAETDNPDTVNPFCTVESITDESGTTNTYRFIHLYAVWQRSVDIYQGNVDGNGDLSDMEESDDDTETAAATASMGLKIDTLTKNIAFTNAKLTSQTAFSLELPNYLVPGYTHKGFVTDYYTGTKPLLTLDTESGKYKVNYDEAITTPTLFNTIQLTQKTQNAFAIYSKELNLYYSNSLTEGGDAYHIQSLTNTYYYYIVKQNGIAIEKYFTQDPLAYPHSDGETYEIGWHIGGFYAQDGVTALDTNLTFVGYTSSGFITPETSTPANFYPYVEIVAGSGNYAFAEGSPLPLTETSQTYYAVYKGASTIYANFSETKQGDTLLFPLKSFYIDDYTNLEFSESDGMKEFFSGTTYAGCRYPFTATQLRASINGVMLNNADIYFCAYQENGSSGLDPYSVQAGTMYTGFGAGSGNKTNANHPEFAYYTIAGWTDYAGLSRVWNTTSGTATNWYNTLDYGTTDVAGNTITRSYYVKYNGNAYASVADGGDGTCDAYGVSKFISVLPGKSVDLYPVFKHTEASAVGSTDPSGAEVINPIMLDEEANKVFEIIDFKYNYSGPIEPIRFRPTYDKSTTYFTVATSYYWLGYSGVELTIKNTSTVTQYIYIHRYQPQVTSGDITSSMFSVTADYSGDLTLVSTNKYSLGANETGTLKVGISCATNPDSKAGDFSWIFGFKYSSSSSVGSSSPNLFQSAKDNLIGTNGLSATVEKMVGTNTKFTETNSYFTIDTSSTSNYIILKLTNNSYLAGAYFDLLGVSNMSNNLTAQIGTYNSGTGVFTQDANINVQFTSGTKKYYSEYAANYCSLPKVAFGQSIYCKISVSATYNVNLLFCLYGYDASDTDENTPSAAILNFAYNGITLGETKVNAKGQEFLFDYIEVIAGYTKKANEYSGTAKVDNIYNKLTYFNSTSEVNYYPESEVAMMGDFFQISASDDFPGNAYIKLNYEATNEFIHITFDKNGGTSFICTPPAGGQTTTEQGKAQLLRYGYLMGESAPNGLVYKTQNATTGTTEYITATKSHAIFLGWYTSSTGGQKILDKDGKFNTQDGCVSVVGYITEDGKWYANSIVLYAHFSDTVYAVMVCNNFEGSVPNGVANEHEYSSLTCTSHSSFVKSDTLPYLNYDVINTANNLVYDLNGYYQDLNYDGNKTDGNWHISPTGTSGVYKYVPFSNANKTDICDHYIIWYVSEGQTGTSGREGFYLRLANENNSAGIVGNCDIKISGLAIPTVRDTDEGDYTAAANDSDSTLAKFRRGNSWKMTQFTTQFANVNCNITGTVDNALNTLNTAGNMVPITLSGSHYITVGNGIITANYERLYTKITLDASVSVYNSLFIGEGKFPDEKTKKTVFTYYGANAVYTNRDCLPGGKISSTNFKNSYCPTREISDKTIDCIYKFIAWSYYKTSSTFAEVISTNNTFISNALSFTTLSRWSYYDKADTNGIELYALFDYDYNERMDLLLKVAPNTQEITITTGSLNVVSINIGKQSTTGVADITQITYKYKNLGNSLIKITINEISSISDIEGILFDISDLTSSSNKISAKYKASHTITGFYTTNKLDINAFFFQFSEDPASDLSENYTPDTYILLSLPKDYVYCIKYTEKELINDGIFEYILTEDSAGKIKYDYYTASGARGVIDDSSQPTQIDTTSNADYYSFTYHYSISERLLYLANNPEYKKVVVYGYSSNATLDGIAVDINKPQSLADRWEIEGNGWLLGRYTSLLSASQGANSNKNIEYLEIVDDVQVDSNITLHSYVFIFGTNNNITIKFGSQTNIQVLDIGLIICDLKANYFSFIDSSGDIEVFDCEIKGEISIKCSKVKLYDVTCNTIRIKDSDPTKTKLYINGNVTFNNKKNQDIIFDEPIKVSVDPCIEINVVLTCDIEIVTEDISEILESSSSRVNIVKSKNKSLKTYISLIVKCKDNYGVERYDCYIVDYDETKSIYYVSGRVYVVNIKEAIENETIHVDDIIRVYVCQISAIVMASSIYEYSIVDTANNSMYDHTITMNDIARGFFYLQIDKYIKQRADEIEFNYKIASINGNELKYEIKTSREWNKNYINKEEAYHSIIGKYYYYKVDKDCSFGCLSFFHFELERNSSSKKIKIDASSYTNSVYFSTFEEITTAYKTTYEAVYNNAEDEEKAYVSDCNEYFLITSAIKYNGGYFYLK